MKIAIVASRFNEKIVLRLVQGAKQGLKENKTSDYEIFWVPGAFEIPVMCKHLIDRGKYDALIALGVVIKGDTDHYEHVCRTCADGIASLSRESGVPIIFEVLMCKTLSQALLRGGGRLGNRGYDAVKYALQIISAIKEI